MSGRYARLLNPGVVMTTELKQRLAEYEACSREKSTLDQEIRQLRQQQEAAEDQLAEDLAEDEFQRTMQGQRDSTPSEEDLQEIFMHHLGRIIQKLATIYERQVHLDSDMRKIKQVIDKSVALANEANENEQ